MDVNILDTLDMRQLGQELANARKKRGFTQEDAAKLIGVARTTVTAIENGDRRIKAQELIKLAHMYGHQVSDFVRPRLEIEPFQIQFRGPSLRTVEGDEQIKEYINQLEELCRDYLELEEITKSPLSFNYPPEYEIRGDNLDQEAEVLADQERRRLGLGDRPLINLRDILEQEVGLRVFYLPMQPTTYSAMYLYDRQLGGCIGINKQHPEERRRWSMAHDYSHFLANRFKPALFIEDTYERVPQDERFADLFAGYFLMPTSSILRQFTKTLRRDGSITPAGLCMLAAYYGVSVAAITLRLEAVEKLPSGTWDYLKDQGFKVREAQRQLGIYLEAGRDDLLPIRYQYLAVYAFEEDLITEGQLADFLRVGRVEARRIVEELRRHSEGVTNETPVDIDLGHHIA